MLPKWDPRSRLGVYLGHSPCHTGSVALVLNPKTLHSSPQFHVVFDDRFSIVQYLASSDIPPNWSILVRESESASQQDYNLANNCMDSQQNPQKYLQDQEGVIVQLEETFKKDRKSEWSPEGAQTNPEGDNKY